MFNVSVNDEKNIYRTKPTMNVDITGSSASIPKPLTYDYMPEGYPSKSIEYVTLMEEQEVAFSDSNGLMAANSPVALDIKLGDKLTVVWDGVSYDVVAKKAMAGSTEILAFGNLGLLGSGETTDHPFICGYVGQDQGKPRWLTADTATSHTIGILRQRTIYTPMDINYTPKNLNVVFTGISQQNVPTSCNVTYDELRRLAESDVPIFAIYKFDVSGIPTCTIITKYQLEKADSEGNTKMVFHYQQDDLKQAFVYNSNGIQPYMS